MFTGIVEELGEVVDVERRGESAVLTLAARRVADGLVHGQSIAVNGVCLTVVGWRAEPDRGPAADADDGNDGGDAPGVRVRVDFDVMAETLARSVIGALRSGDRVNLERAARLDSRLDGHIVQGHVDGTGTIVSRVPGDQWESVRIGLPAGLARYVAEKGSVAVDGVSLTVTAVGPDWFEVGLIPETLRATVLGTKPAGSPVNLEVDVLAKYVERLLATRAPGPAVSP